MWVRSREVMRGREGRRGGRGVRGRKGRRRESEEKGVEGGGGRGGVWDITVALTSLQLWLIDVTYEVPALAYPHIQSYSSLSRHSYVTHPLCGRNGRCRQPFLSMTWALR